MARRDFMNKHFIEEVKMGSGYAIYMLLPSNGGGPGKYRKEIEYILTHDLKTVNELDYFIHSLILSSNDSDYYLQFLKETLKKKNINIRTFYNVAIQLSFFARNDSSIIDQTIVPFVNNLIKEKTNLNKNDIIKVDIALYIISNFDSNAVLPILKLLTEHKSFKKFSKILSNFPFMQDYTEQYIDAKIDDKYIFGDDREKEFVKYHNKCVMQEMDIYYNQIDEIIELVGEDKISFDEIDPFTSKSKAYLFEYVINEDYSLKAKCAILSFIYLHSIDNPLTIKQNLQLVNLFYKNIGEDKEFDLLLLNIFKYIRHSKIRSLAKYLIKNELYLEEAAALLAYNITNVKDTSLLAEIWSNLDYYDYYYNQLEIIEAALVELYFSYYNKREKIDDFYPYTLLRHMFDCSQNARLRYDMASILEDKNMLSTRDYAALAFDSTSFENSYFKDKYESIIKEEKNED